MKLSVVAKARGALNALLCDASSAEPLGYKRGKRLLFFSLSCFGDGCRAYSQLGSVVFSIVSVSGRGIPCNDDVRPCVGRRTSYFSQTLPRCGFVSGRRKGGTSVSVFVSRDISFLMVLSDESFWSKFGEGWTRGGRRKRHGYLGTQTEPRRRSNLLSVLITRKGNATRVEPLRIEICTVAIALVRFCWCWSAVVFVNWYKEKKKQSRNVPFGLLRKQALLR